MCLRVCECVELTALVCMRICVCVCVCVQVCISQFDRYEIEFKIALPLSFIQVLAQGYTDFSLNLKTASFFHFTLLTTFLSIYIKRFVFHPPTCITFSYMPKSMIKITI